LLFACYCPAPEQHWQLSLSESIGFIQNHLQTALLEEKQVVADAAVLLLRTSRLKQ
jgi:hypothetical protein